MPRWRVKKTKGPPLNIFGGLSPSYASLVVTLPYTAGFDTFTIPFTLAAGDNVRFSFSNAGADNRGALLDRVLLVPEPATLLLLGLGALASGARFRRRTAKQA